MGNLIGQEKGSTKGTLSVDVGLTMRIDTNELPVGLAGLALSCLAAQTDLSATDTVPL